MVSGREGRVQDREEEPASDVREHVIKEAWETQQVVAWTPTMVVGEESLEANQGPRPIIIDGSNVAMAHGCDKVFSSKGRRKGGKAIVSMFDSKIVSRMVG